MVEGGGLAPGMVYMPMGPHGMAATQQQWPMIPPWMGMSPYYMPPVQANMQEHMNLMAAGRSTSAPDGGNPLGYNLASPLPSAGKSPPPPFLTPHI
jgi:hypothetical protein